MRIISLLVVFFLSFVGSELWALHRGIPSPYIYDEFSYLLAGDTFAHGRLTNPPHPMWMHFETFSEIQNPTYMSMYPPGQGFFLALGQVLFGHPIFGVWLSCALMCAAIAWMLYAWLPPRWALIGGLVAVLQFGVFTYWSQSYWGGAVAALGGALVLGALPRIFNYQRTRDALWLGLGCAILANSRPLEGFLVAIPVAVLLLPWNINWRSLKSTQFIRHIIVPLSILLLMTAAGVGVYNKTITRDPKIFPHVLHDQMYRRVPFFIFQPLNLSLRFDHPMMETSDKESNEAHYLAKRTAGGFLKSMQRDLGMLFKFFFGYPLGVPALIMMALALFNAQTSLRSWLALAWIAAACAAVSYSILPHYLAPLTAVAVWLIVQGLRGLQAMRLRRMSGTALVILLMMGQLWLNLRFTPIVPAVKSLAHITQSRSIHSTKAFTREELQAALLRQGGKYLILVSYPSTHNHRYEWVYNASDINHAPIVWARDMGPRDNQELIDYFKDRQEIGINVFWDLPGLMNFYARQ